MDIDSGGMSVKPSRVKLFGEMAVSPPGGREGSPPPKPRPSRGNLLSKIATFEQVSLPNKASPPPSPPSSSPPSPPSSSPPSPPSPPSHKQARSKVREREEKEDAHKHKKISQSEGRKHGHRPKKEYDEEEDSTSLGRLDKSRSCQTAGRFG